MKRTAALALFVSLASSCGTRGVQQVRPQLVPPDPTADFGTVPVLNDKTLELPIRNVGKADLLISNIALKTPSKVFVIGAMPTRIQPAEVAMLKVTFTPDKEASYEDSLTFESNDGDLPTFEVSLKGIGSTRAIMGIDPASLDFGRVGECAAAVKTFSIESKGTADLVVKEISFVPGTDPAFSFVGSSKTPAVVKTTTPAGLPGKIQLTVKYAVAMGSTAPATGGIRIVGTDPDKQEVVIPLSGTPNKAPLAIIAPLGNGAPGSNIALDGSGSSDPDGDVPLTYKWTLRQKPLASNTTIAPPDVAMASMQLDPQVPGAYEVQLDVTDSQGVKSCQPARATVVATPAQKLLIEMFWDNAKTDIDLHVLQTPTSAVGTAPDDCFYANTKPDWGMPGVLDDPELLRDALVGYGPEIFGYKEPVNGTFRAVVSFANAHLETTPTSKVTVRFYVLGVVKGEFTKTLDKEGQFWTVGDVTWPSGVVTENTTP